MCVFTVDKLCKCLITCHETCSKMSSLMHDILIRDILSFMCGVWSEKCKGFFYSWPLSFKHARYQRPEIAISAVSLHGQHFNSKKVNCFRLAKSGKTKSYNACVIHLWNWSETNRSFKRTAVLLIKLFTDDIGDSLARKPIQDSRDRKRNSNERRIGSTRKLNPERLALTSISKI